MTRPLLRAGCVLLAMFTWGGVAGAFCRTTTCDASKGECTPDPANPGCIKGGVPIAWRSRCVSVSLNQAASQMVPFDVFDTVARAGFSAWSSVDCSGAPPSLAFDFSAPVACDGTEYNAKVGNANIVVFRDGVWPHGNAGSTLALTTVTFGVDTGTILDADMEINGQATLTTTDTGVKTDLLSILTHEAGHFSGYSHSPVKGATMGASYSPGSVSLRSLEDDDRAAACTVYPPARGAACDATPPGGFSALCGAQQPGGSGGAAGGGSGGPSSPAASSANGGCCSTAPGSGRADREGLWLAFAAIVVWRRRGRPS